MTRTIIGSFNRVEGDLELRLDINAGVISKAKVCSPLFRGFERILSGKAPQDALVYTPRICGICSIAQSMAAAKALAKAQNLKPAPNGQLVQDIILACENVADHLTHFYLFFMPDFASDFYKKQKWHSQATDRFRTQTGKAMPPMLLARAQFLHINAILAGKWPHTLGIQPGGMSKAVELSDLVHIQKELGLFRSFLEQQLFADSLENIQALTSIHDLENWQEKHSQSDFSYFLNIASKLNLAKLGVSQATLMSYGAYHNKDQKLFRSGIYANSYAKLDPNLIQEDISHSWLLAKEISTHPFDGNTKPEHKKPGAYSWCKAPRLDDKVVEVGALARQVIQQQPLPLELYKLNGANVQNRVIGRLLEIAYLVPQIEKWLEQINIKQPFCTHANIPKEAEGVGMIEAARGSLGHWLRIKNSRILNYQIIAPTTWNFSPQDQNNIPGALEQALLGTKVENKVNQSAAVQHIIRSFDPCMVCTVH